MAATTINTAPRIERKSVTGGTLLRVSGTIDERFNPDELVAHATGAVVVLDLDEVRRITSFGVARWLSAVSRLTASYLGFVRARPAVLSQFNMVANFAASGELLSFYAPYICPSCHHDFEHLVDVKRQQELIRKASAPVLACPSCGAAADLDEIAESYFSFPASAREPSPPPIVSSLLDGSAFRQSAPLKVGKQVVDQVTLLAFSGALDQRASLKRLADGLEGEVVIDCGSVTDVTADGLYRFVVFLKSAQAKVWLREVPFGLLRMLGSDPSWTHETRIASARVPVALTCGHFEELAVTPTQARALAEGGMAVSCPTCTSAGTAKLDDAGRALLGRMPLGELPASAWDALRAPETTATAPVGRNLGRYTLLRMLGAGGMAQVWLARQSGAAGFERHVVVKRVLPQLANDSSIIRMLLDEARIASRINHPNVVQIFDVGQDGAEYFIAMEYVRGWDLSHVLRTSAKLERRIPVPVALQIAVDIFGALHGAHAATSEEGRPLGIVHRDVSPHNILISTEGQLKLTDFGIARAADSAALTPYDSVKGKLSYMAPEQLGATRVRDDPRIDIYAAGIVLYQLLTGEQLYRRDTEPETIRAILEAAQRPLRDSGPDFPEALDTVLTRALHRDPAQRYGSAAAAQRDLRELQATLAPQDPQSLVVGFVRQLMEDGRNLARPDGGKTGLTPTGWPKA